MVDRRRPAKARQKAQQEAAATVQRKAGPPPSGEELMRATDSTGTDGSLPLIEELAPAPQAEDVFGRMAGLPHCLFLDSALAHPTLGRYSFVAADPFDFVQFPADGSDALKALAERLGRFTATSEPGCRPFREARPACWATISDAVWNVCRSLRPTSFACRRWLSVSTT